MPEESDFEVLPAGKMREKYGLYAENRPILHLNPENVPCGLRHLIPLAERFGVADDLIREDVLKKASAGEIEELHRLVREWETPLMEWLGGPAADERSPSEEYVAFSAMVIAHDCA